MTAYHLNRVLYLLHTDASFLAGFRADASAALSDLPLSPTIGTALIQGDVTALYLAGAHPFLLHGLVRHQLCGVDQERYMTDVRRAVAEHRQPAASEGGNDEG